MSLNESIIKIRVDLQKSKLKKSGKNKFAGFEYYELSDFLPKLNELMLENKVNDIMTIEDGNATLKLTKGEEIQSYSIPFVMFDVPKNKNGGDSMQHIQYLGALNTYYKRYLYLNAFGITDGEVIDSLDNDNIQLQQKPQSQKQYSINDIKELANIKNFPIETIENGFKKKLEQFTLVELNKAYITLQSK